MTEVQFAKQFLTVLDNKPQKYKSDHVFDPKTFQLRIPYTLPKLSHPQHPLPPKSAPTTAPPPGSELATPAPPTIDLTLKSTRNPTFTLHLPSLPQTTPITTLKSQIQTLLKGNGASTSTTSIALEKIKILHNKKPIPASKSTVRDVLSDSPSLPPSIELGVIILGGAPDPIPTEQTIPLDNTSTASGPDSENAAVEATTGANPADTLSTPVPPPAVMEGVETHKRRRESVPVQPGESSGKAVLRQPEFWDDLQGFLEQRLRDKEEAERLRGLFEKAVVGG